MSARAHVAKHNCLTNDTINQSRVEYAIFFLRFTRTEEYTITTKKKKQFVWCAACVETMIKLDSFSVINCGAWHMALHDTFAITVPCRCVYFSGDLGQWVPSRLANGSRIRRDSAFAAILISANPKWTETLNPKYINTSGILLYINSTHRHIRASSSSTCNNLCQQSLIKRLISNDE